MSNPLLPQHLHNMVKKAAYGKIWGGLLTRESQRLVTGMGGAFILSWAIRFFMGYHIPENREVALGKLELAYSCLSEKERAV